MSAAVLADQSVAPGSPIDALLRHSGPVLLDFDETLYLRNSTEDFIDSARPSLWALLLLRLLDAIKPWRWTGGNATRDAWRVRCIMTLFPWTKTRWEKRVVALAAKLSNTALIAAVQKRAQMLNLQPVMIATIGFEAVVAPLAAAMGLSRLRIIGSRLSTFEDRRDGKFKLVTSRIGHEAVRRSLFLTDSKDDESLLDACAVPLLVHWPESRFRPAFANQYVPGQYLTLVKRPGERYISRGVLQEDFALWVLTSLSLAMNPLVHVVGLLFLLLSFWSIYEAGYVDNDRTAARFEHDPKLSRAFGRAAVVTPRFLPWVWALISGAVGVLILRGFERSALIGFASWVGVLATTFAGFALYNRLDKATRIWWYCGLQLARSAAFVVLVPIQLIGAMAIGAHVVAKWMPYYIYRVGGKSWPEGSHFLTRLLVFAVLAVLLAIAGGFATVWNWTAAALIAWNVFRARHELLHAVGDATRIDRDREPSAIDRRRAP